MFVPNFEDAIRDVDTNEKNIPNITNNEIVRQDEDEKGEDYMDYLYTIINFSNREHRRKQNKVEYNKNSRIWQSFSSRNSFELNQDYLYLTLRSIINKCDQCRFFQ